MSASPSDPGCSCGGPLDYATSTDWASDVSRRLYEHLAEVGFAGRSVLEIGCGYGRLLVGALLAGSSAATGVELDDEALDGARERAEEAGVGERCRLLAGDGAELELAAHDLVVLDRVICCYDDARRLVQRSATVAGDLVALSVPESRGPMGAWNRLTYSLGALLDRVRGLDRAYLHDVGLIEAWLAAAGFGLYRADRLGKWYLGIYRRVALR